MRPWEEFMIAFLFFGLDSDLHGFILANMFLSKSLVTHLTPSGVSNGVI